MQGFEPFAMIMGSARRFAVDGDELVPVRPQRRNPAVETAAEQDRVDPVDEGTHPALAGDAVMELRKAPQKGEMVSAPRDDGRRNRRRRQSWRRSPAAGPPRADTSPARARGHHRASRNALKARPIVPAGSPRRGS